jgi:hypothetical protein
MWPQLSRKARRWRAFAIVHLSLCGRFRICCRQARKNLCAKARIFPFCGDLWRRQRFERYSLVVLAVRSAHFSSDIGGHRQVYAAIALSALSIENLPIVPSSKVTPKQRVV